MVTDILILALAIRITTMDGIFRFMGMGMVIAILIMVTGILTMDTAILIMVTEIHTTDTAVLIMAMETITITIIHTTQGEEALPIPIE